jgi:putative NADH-flavin reductase
LLAETKAKYEAEKLQAVIKAEEKKEIARQQALEAKFTADKIEQEGRAKAAANQALVRAGLTPQEKAQFDKDTKIGMARELAKRKVPKLMIVGGNGSGADPMSAVAIKMLLDIEGSLKDLDKK